MAFRLIAADDFETPFGSHQRGDEISDPIEIEWIRSNDNFRRVVVVSDTVVPPPPPVPPTSPLAGVLQRLSMLEQRVAALEALPPGGGPPPPPPPSANSGSVLIDQDGTALTELDGDVLVL